MAEDNFLDCLALNARKPVNTDGIPSECQECFKSFVSFGGEQKIDGIIQEFKEVAKTIPAESKRISTKKIVIGCVIGVTAAGVIIVAAPVVFPGTIVAAKAAAITANAKAAGSIILVKTGKAATAAATTLYQAAQATPDTAIEVVNVTKDVAVQLYTAFNALPLKEKIIQAAEIAEKVNKFTSFYSALKQPVRDKLENDLFANYYKKGSLTERIKKAYNVK
ncbi:MAG: hypothetical protein ACOYT8_03745 [Candidatus Dependentiae bacterium]